MLWKTALAPGDHTEQYTCYVVEHLQPPARMFASLACVMLLSKGEMATMIIREATAADAEGIAHVHVASWHTTYTGIIPDDVIAQMSDPQRRLAQWQRFLAEEHPRESAFVAADDDGRIVGFARCTPTRSGAEDAAIYPGELESIYLLQETQGRGVGRQLVRAVAARLAQQGMQAMIVWVFVDNPARRFYEALGGQFVREQSFTIAGAELREVAYGWRDTSVLLK